MPSQTLGIDIGGANLKFAGEGIARIVYFPMWKNSEKLEKFLKSISEEVGAEKAGIVMTAELSDVFRTKEEGVRRIVDACRKAFDEVRFLTLNGELIPVEDVENPLDLAASNWIASVTFLLEEGFRNFLFVDMGSTTVDVIPVTSSIRAGRTDYERLRRGELLYFGKLRTPIFHLVREFNGVKLCPEYFAITADAMVVSGMIGENDYTCETPDGKGKSVEDCMRRIARTLCCDLEEIGSDNVKKLSEFVVDSMIEIVGREMERKITEYGLKTVIACGIGEDVIEEGFRKFVPEHLNVRLIKLSERYGRYSDLFPAYAVYRMADRRF